MRSIINGDFILENEKKRRELQLTTRKELWQVQEAFWEAYSEEDWDEALRLGSRLSQSEDESFYYEAATLFSIYFDELGKQGQGGFCNEQPSK